MNLFEQDLEERPYGIFDTYEDYCSALDELLEQEQEYNRDPEIPWK